MPQARSKYITVWEQVKTLGKCSVVAETRFHQRIKKAIVKRKDEDLAFKLECAENGTKYKLKSRLDPKNNMVLVFTLEKVLGANDL